MLLLNLKINGKTKKKQNTVHNKSLNDKTCVINTLKEFRRLILIQSKP